MSTEIKDRLTRIIAMCEGNSGVCNDIRFEASMALQDVESQTVAVIAPAIEWEQDPEDQRWWYGKDRDSKYSLKVFGNKIISRHGSDILFVELDNSMDDAKAICQAHKQAQVNAVLEVCNVRDPQPLLDILKQATTYCESKIARVESGFSDERFIEIMGEKFTSTLKSWEEAQ